MKKMRKIVSLLLAMVMVFAMSTTAFAEETYSITINNSKSDHIYEAYQIFKGDLHETTLSNITWGSGVTDAGKTSLLTFKGTTYETPAKLAAALTTDNAVEFANEAAKYLGTAAASASTLTDGKYVISGLEAGYYLVKDQNKSLQGDTDSYTNYILKVVGDVEASPKGSIPTVEKKVKEDDKTIDGDKDNRIPDYAVGSGYNDVADYCVGEAVPFKLIGTLPSNYADYDTYKYVFHDTLASTLSYNNDAKVYVENITGTETAREEITDLFKVTQNGNDLTISATDLTTNTSILATSYIVVEYTAKLTSDSVIGLPGNENTVYLEFSNNPNADGSGDTGNTPVDKVIVFTYELDVNKVAADSTTTKLQGAEFKLYNADQSEAANVVDGVFAGWVEKANGTTLTSDANGFFTVKGLDDGTYFLEETKAPVGYNLLEAPIKLVITATTVNNQSWTDYNAASALTALSITVDTVASQAGDVNTGIVNVTVQNNKGATLPSTGGVGTTLFYVAGIAMMLAATFVFVSRKRDELA